MKKNILLLLILIGFVSCSNGQNRNNLDETKNLSKDIIGCWKVCDVRYEVKSNSILFDSLFLVNRKKFVDEAKKKIYISKFFIDGMVKDFQSDGTPFGYDEYYVIKGDSLITHNNIRYDSRSASKISIKNDTLHLETSVFKELDKVYTDLKWGGEVEIPDNITIEVAKKYATFIRIRDCDQYQ